MKIIFVNQIKDGNTVNDFFLVANKSAFRTASNGKPFFNLELVDRSGRMPAVMWDAPQKLYESFKNGSYIQVRGRAGIYKEKIQLNIENIAVARDSDIDKSQFLPKCKRDIGEMKNEFLKISSSVKGPLSIIIDEITQPKWFEEVFCNCPAASHHHHGYIGGLLEHSLDVAKICDSICKIKPELNRDLLITAALFHDIGKTSELSFSGSFEYTEQGSALGHITIGAIMLEKFKPDIFPTDIMMELTHLIISHHGQMEHGSPIVPMTPEAFALHMADNLDAQLNACQRIFTENMVDGTSFSEFNKHMARKLYKRRVTDDTDEI